MKIHVQQIRPQGLELKESYPPESTGLTEDDFLHFTAPVAVDARVTRTDDEIFVDITAASGYASACSRCLEEIRQDWTCRFTLTVSVGKNQEFIEVDEDIRQELILNLPGRVLCRPDCKGLCVDCGANLNTQKCKHNHLVVSDRRSNNGTS